MDANSKEIDKIYSKKIILYSLILIISSCGYAKKSPTIEFVLDPESKLSIIDVVQNYNGSFQNVKDNFLQPQQRHQG